MCAQSLSCVQLFETPWSIAHQAPLSIEFSRQKYWSGSLFPTPGDIPNPGIEPVSLALLVDSSPLSQINYTSIKLKRKGKKDYLSAYFPRC